MLRPQEENPSSSLMSSPGARCRLARALYHIAVGTRAMIHFTKEPYSQDALHGRGAILRCEVQEPADVEFEWLQNGLPVQETEQRFKEGSNLQFAAVDRHRDAGDFQCVARNLLTGEEARTANASFNIKWIETGSVVLKQPASVAEIQPSSTVVLRCHIDGHPRPTWQWFRDGSPLPDSRSTYSVSNKERTLTLQSASPDDNGLYYCCARSAVGFVCSQNNFTLNIIDESFPQAVIVPQDLIVTKNEEAMFDCQFAAVPPPTQEWLFEDSPITNRSNLASPHVPRTTVFANGSLLITQVRARSTGVYKCVGHGQRGKTLVLKATLRLAAVPKWVEMPKDSQLEESKPGYLHCLSKASLKPTVTWYRNGVSISEVRQWGKPLPLMGTSAGHLLSSLLCCCCCFLPCS
ncbi:hypothetical protein llap_20465 [Limosa lapponica baueri]|uniref:Ig-like domain-containing protein n=1 Tax=Limosa lapponica baueri TaxID=1758121 RepID=A0A2I0T613_LIMLA|nr:hypothetical protein llap_20465 [Limosa lapponica baueri]